MTKIIFCHNVIEQSLNRLKVTLEKNSVVNHASPIYIAYYGPRNATNLAITGAKIKFCGPVQTHEVGAFNGMVQTINHMLDHEHEGVVVFSHDDVYINNKELFKKNLDIIKDYDLIVRHPSWCSYYMFDSLIFNINKKTTRMFRSIQKVTSRNKFPVDVVGHPCPEGEFTKYLLNSGCTFYKHAYGVDVGTQGNQNHGFYHMLGRCI